MRLAVLVWAVHLLLPGGARAQLAPPEPSWPRFVCEEGRCPTGVGALIVHRPAGQAFCTATLIAPDRIVTADHCVGAPDEPMDFFLPDERAVTVVRRPVAAVLHATGRERGGDHAVLRLAGPIDQAAAAVWRAELPFDGRLSVFRATPHDDHTVFLRRERCIVRPRALHGASTAGLVRIAGCTILPGNSGAPMLDSHGRIVAVVSSALSPSGVAVILAPWLRGRAPFVGTVSSLACVPRPFAPGVAPSACARPLPDASLPDPSVLTGDEVRDAALDVEREALAAELLHWDERGDGVEWSLSPRVDGDRTVAVPQPACVDPGALARRGRLDRRGRFAITADVPTWEASASLGEEVQMVPLTRRIDRVRVELRGRLAPDLLSAEVRLRGRGAPRPARPVRVPACP